MRGVDGGGPPWNQGLAVVLGEVLLRLRSVEGRCGGSMLKCERKGLKNIKAGPSCWLQMNWTIRMSMRISVRLKLLALAR